MYKSFCDSTWLGLFCIVKKSDSKNNIKKNVLELNEFILDHYNLLESILIEHALLFEKQN